MSLGCGAIVVFAAVVCRRSSARRYTEPLPPQVQRFNVYQGRRIAPEERRGNGWPVRSEERRVGKEGSVMPIEKPEKKTQGRPVPVWGICHQSQKTKHQ